MTERSVTHATFVIERTYDAAPARVFNAFADPVAKARWFEGPDEWITLERGLDFRVGGREVNRGGPPGGLSTCSRRCYHDIVPNERIITTYEMYMDETRSSVSIATVEFEPAGDGHDPALHGAGGVPGRPRLGGLPRAGDARAARCARRGARG